MEDNALHSVGRILLVDDDEVNLYLADQQVDIDEAVDGNEAWSMLRLQPDRYDVVLLDRVMPGIDGLELIKRIKSAPELRFIPVIFQTSMTASKDAKEGIEAGAYYYLGKPFSKLQITSVTHTAISDSLSYRQRKIVASLESRELTGETRFEVRTLDEARNLAGNLALLTDNPSESIVGLGELLINAIEHGNLGIGYDKKNRLVDGGSWLIEIEYRLGLPENRDKVVEVTCSADDRFVYVRIKDQGKGFAWEKYLEMSPERLCDNHGRGIAMTRALIFASIEYRVSSIEYRVSSIEYRVSPAR